MMMLDMLHAAAQKESCCTTCKYGWCCYEPVWVDECEVDYILKQLNEAEIELLKVRTKAWYEVFSKSGLLEITKYDGEDRGPDGKDFTTTYAYRWRQHKTACPLFNVETGKCSVYEHKPAACSMFYAMGKSEDCATDRRFTHSRVAEFKMEIVGAIIADTLSKCGKPDVIAMDHLGVLLHNKLFGTSIKTAEREEGFVYYYDDGVELTKERKET